jgi:hypothetical protein
MPGRSRPSDASCCPRSSRWACRAAILPPPARSSRDLTSVSPPATHAETTAATTTALMISDKLTQRRRDEIVLTCKSIPEEVTQHANTSLCRCLSTLLWVLIRPKLRGPGANQPRVLGLFGGRRPSPLQHARPCSISTGEWLRSGPTPGWASSTALPWTTPRVRTVQTSATASGTDAAVLPWKYSTSPLSLFLAPSAHCANPRAAVRQGLSLSGPAPRSLPRH